MKTKKPTAVLLFIVFAIQFLFLIKCQLNALIGWVKENIQSIFDDRIRNKKKRLNTTNRKLRHKEVLIPFEVKL